MSCTYLPYSVELDLNRIAQGVAWFILPTDDTRGVVRRVADGEWHFNIGSTSYGPYATWHSAVDALEVQLNIDGFALRRAG